MTWTSVTMEGTVRLVGLAVALLLTIGCEGAPSQNVEARSILVNPHIVMGKDANIEDIPYQLSIEFLRMHACGAVIISEEYVITAAHCLDPWLSGPNWFKRLRVGSTTSIPIVGTGGEIRQIAEAKTHPQWDATAIDYDVGVIRVSTKMVFNDRIQPIVVGRDENSLDYSLPAQVSGWGLTEPGGFFTPWHLKVAEIPLVPRDNCSKLYEGAPSHIPKVTTRMLCGAGTGNGGPCQGDSGGPLVHKGEVVGLVSWALSCNDPTYPTVFTNLLEGQIREFIQSNTGF